jgi:uncharacterized GH25 family protein
MRSGVLYWLVLAASLLVGHSFSSAHDLWLVPEEKADVGKPVIIRANVGMEFPKSETAPDTSAFVKRILVKPNATRATLEAAGKEGISGLLRFAPEAPGVYIAAVQTRPRVLDLDADAFNRYLVSDGLPHIYLLRANEKTLHKPARERYQKSPKVLIQVGDRGKGKYSEVVGLPLEIVPLSDPFRLTESKTLTVRVLFQGKPLPDANLGWAMQGDGETPRGTVRTDEYGLAYIPISRIGLMTIRLTHMTRPKKEDYEWESFWTSLTFRSVDPDS